MIVFPDLPEESESDSSSSSPELPFGHLHNQEIVTISSDSGTYTSTNVTNQGDEQQQS